MKNVLDYYTPHVDDYFSNASSSATLTNTQLRTKYSLSGPPTKLCDGIYKAMSIIGVVSHPLQDYQGCLRWVHQ
jgi:hypothetical protein